MTYCIEETKNVEVHEETVIALGNFDGFHYGHRQLITECASYAKDHQLKSLVFSFYPHPSHVLPHLDPVPMLYTREEKRRVVSGLGVDYYLEYPFDEDTAKTPAEEFISQVLVKQLKVKAIVVGENYRFGYKRQGDIALLESLKDQYGYTLIVIPTVSYSDHRISSTKIRQCIQKGEMEDVSKLLTQPYFATGKVIYGKQLGRTLGFPTVNMEVQLHKLYPGAGVYVSRTYYKDKCYHSVTNVGYNPTVTDTEQLKVETYVLNFEEKIYGETITVEFLNKIRDELKFNSLDELIEQMKKDVQYTESYFKRKEQCQ